MKQYSFLILMIIQLIWLWFCYSDSYYDHLNQIHISHILILILWFWILYICSTVLSVLQRQKSVFQYFYWIFVDALQLSSYQYFSTLFRNSVFYFWNFEFPISIFVLLSVQVFSILSFYLSVIQSHFIRTL